METLSQPRMEKKRLWALVLRAILSATPALRANLIMLQVGEQIVEWTVRNRKDKITLQTSGGRRASLRDHIQSCQTDDELREIHGLRREQIRGPDPESRHTLARWLKRVGLTVGEQSQLLVSLRVELPMWKAWRRPLSGRSKQT